MSSRHPLIVALLLTLASIAAGQPTPSPLTLSANAADIRTVGGPDGSAWNLWSNGEVGAYLKLTPGADYRVTVRAYGSPAGDDWPHMALTVDREIVGQTLSVNSAQPADYRFDFTASAPVQRLAAAFLNDYYEGPGQDRNLYVVHLIITPTRVDAALARTDEAAWRSVWEPPQLAREREIVAGTRSAIEQHRKSNAVIQVVDRAGQPVRDAQVVAELTRHDFLFGCNIYMFGRFGTHAENELYKKRFADLFNYATTGFYWRSYEPIDGQPQYADTDQVVAWCQAQGIALKGHPLLWNIGHGFPVWSQGLPSPERCAARVREIMQRYQGRITRWEVVNEPAHVAGLPIDAPYRWARAADPKAELIVNDYQVMADGFPPFYAMLKQAQDAGVPFDGIGIQAHEPTTMRFPLDRVVRTLDHYATLGKPLHITEFSPASGEKPITGSHVRGAWTEAAQADYAEKFYRVCFAHRAVVALTWWDLCDNGAWLKGGGMLRADLSPKPVYAALRRLIRDEWHTRVAQRTDQAGHVAFRGFRGQYHVLIRQGERVLETDVTLTEPEQQFTLTLPE